MAFKRQDRSSSADALAPTQASAFKQPTSQIALTTTFTPPSVCTDQHITMVADWAFQMWLNEPSVTADKLSGQCYPTEYIQEYSLVTVSSSHSSIVPAMSNIVCPENYCTAHVQDAGNNQNYVACCPIMNGKAMGIHLADTPVVTSRPAYGGTCYSDLTAGSSYLITKVLTDGSSAVAYFFASTKPASEGPDQIYAHPIDGFLPDESGSPTVGCAAVPKSSAPSSAQSSAPAAPLTEPKSVSGGTIAGATIGAVAGLSLIIALIVFFLRRRRQKAHSSSRPIINHVDHDNAREAHEKDGEIPTSEMSAVAEQKGFRKSQLNEGWGAFELNGEQTQELDGSSSGYNARDGKHIPPGMAV